MKFKKSASFFDFYCVLLIFVTRNCNPMNNDLYQPISQRGSGEETEENSRIQEVADELNRRCQLYEAQLRESQKHVNQHDLEAHVAELYAKEKKMWLPMEEVFHLGVPGPSGNENDTFVSNDIIYKVNNLLNCQGSILCLLEKVMCHNNLFYDTSYSLYAFTGFEGRTILPVLQQNLVKNAEPATTVEIETYMAAIGFEKQGNEGRFSNGEYEVWDLLPRNVLKDAEGDVFIVDAEIRFHR